MNIYGQKIKFHVYESGYTMSLIGGSIYSDEIL